MRPVIVAAALLILVSPVCAQSYMPNRNNVSPAAPGSSPLINQAPISGQAPRAGYSNVCRPGGQQGCLMSAQAPLGTPCTCQTTTGARVQGMVLQ